MNFSNFGAAFFLSLSLSLSIYIYIYIYTHTHTCTQTQWFHCLYTEYKKKGFNEFYIWLSGVKNKKRTKCRLFPEKNLSGGWDPNKLFFFQWRRSWIKYYWGELPPGIFAHLSYKSPTTTPTLALGWGGILLNLSLQPQVLADEGTEVKIMFTPAWMSRVCQLFVILFRVGLKEIWRGACGIFFFFFLSFFFFRWVQSSSPSPPFSTHQRLIPTCRMLFLPS